MERHYEVLGVSPDASLATIREHYRTLLTEHHPDQGGRRERFLTIKHAYEEITGERAPESATPATKAVETIRPDAPTYEIESTDTPSVPLSVAGDLLTLSLVSFADSVDVSRLVDTPGVGSELERSVACFEVRNSGSTTCQWRGPSETRFIGTDGFMYEASTVLSPGRSVLPEEWWPGAATMEPETGLHAVVVADEVPEPVSVDRVVYTQHESAQADSATERYLFELDRAARKRLEPLPFELKAD